MDAKPGDLRPIWLKLSGLGKRKRGLCPLLHRRGPAFHGPSVDAKPLLREPNATVELIRRDLSAQVFGVKVLVDTQPTCIDFEIGHSMVGGFRPRSLC